MHYLWLPFLSFLLCVSAICLMKPIAVRVGLVDITCTRKQHKGAIPLFGGVAIYLAVLKKARFSIST